MKKVTKILISISIFLMLVIPAVSLAAPLLPTCATPTEFTGKEGGTFMICGWADLMKLIDNLIHFILYGLAVPIAAIMMAYAGFLLITAGGDNAGARTKAKSIFWNTVLGLAIAIGAFLIVKTILALVGYTGPGLNPPN